MFSILITERGGAQRQLDLDAAEVSVGRLEDNDVVLPRSNVSKRHAQILLKDDRYVLVDLRSTNGTYLNGRRITAPMNVVFGDKIYIGDFILALQDTPRRHVVPRRREPRPMQAEASPVHAGPTDPPVAATKTTDTTTASRGPQRWCTCAERAVIRVASRGRLCAAASRRSGCRATRVSRANDTAALYVPRR